MPFVLDASIAACWAFDDEDHPTAALARKHRLTVYDASYLELAQRDPLPLATLDKDLRRAVNAETVGLLNAGTVP